MNPALTVAMLPAHSTHVPDPIGWVLTVLLVLAAALIYLHAARRRRLASRGWPSWRSASFLVGLVLVAAALSPPMQTLSHHDPRGHMIQHLLLGMFAPLALVPAAPATLLLPALPRTARKTICTLLRGRIMHQLTHPATAATLDMGALYLLYLTPLYSFTADHALIHQLVNLHFLLAGSLFTWSIAGPDPAPRRPGIPVRVAVLIAAGGAHGYLAKLLYAGASTLPLAASLGVKPTHMAAQLMYYGGDLTELALAIALFRIRYRQRRPRSAASTHSGRPAG